LCAVDLAINIDKTPKGYPGGRLHSKALIDGEKVSWLFGGNKMGVMTKRAKWALRRRKMLKIYKRKWWRERTFDVAMKAAYEICIRTLR